MTQEEKAKAYDEALERARKLYESYNRLVLSTDEIERIFPELAESEDERIREEMIRYFTEMKKGGSVALPYDDCITYLKRLKEYEITEEDKKIIPEALVMLCDDIINHRVHTPIKTDEEGARKIKAFLKTFNRQPHKTMEEWEKQKEQKSKWSEEDEKNLKSVVSTLWFALNTPHFPLNYERIIELEGWLRSLRPQPKKNDMITPNKEFFQWIYDRLVNVHNEDPNVDYMISFKKRIEELSFDKPSWKPTDEQIKALHTAAYIDGMDYYGGLKSKLLSLYGDLKKLI